MSHRVLVIDDSMSITRQLTKMLDSWEGYEVVGSATNGVDGIKRYAELSPDIVLLDIVMPAMGGHECLRTLKSQDANATVVMVSSVGGMARNVEKSYQLGARSVVTKPFNEEALKAALERLFEKE